MIRFEICIETQRLGERAERAGGGGGGGGVGWLMLINMNFLFLGTQLVVGFSMHFIHATHKSAFYSSSHVFRAGLDEL